MILESKEHADRLGYLFRPILTLGGASTVGAPTPTDGQTNNRSAKSHVLEQVSGPPRALPHSKSDTFAGVNRDRLPERIYLVGFMGAGKTTVGRELASLVGYEFVDTDLSVESLEGRTIEELFRERGEGYFREKEWEILASTALRHRIVVATGGGLYLAPLHRNFIRRHGAAVWLDVTVEEAWARCGSIGGRPLFTTPDEMATLLESRRSRYELAEFRIEVSGRSVAEVAREIEAVLLAAPDSRKTEP